MDIDKAAILIKKVSLEFDKISNPMFAQYDLTASQYKILKFLYMQPTRTGRVVDIERCYSMTHPTAIGLLDTLEKKGLVTRVRNPEDARSRLITLTEKADAMEEDLDHIGDRLEEILTENLTKREREQLIRLLRKLMKEG